MITDIEGSRTQLRSGDLVTNHLVNTYCEAVPTVNDEIGPSPLAALIHSSVQLNTSAQRIISPSR